MQRTARLSSQPDFFLGKLGATETPIDPSMAAYFGLLDVERRDWSPELIDGAGLDESLLPPIRQPGTIVGTVDDQAARATGLEVGTPLVLAGSDCSCCMIGAGAVEPGQVVAYIGTAGGISRMVEAPTRDPRRAVTCLPHTPPDSWEIEALLLSAGVAYKRIPATSSPRMVEMGDERRMGHSKGHSPPSPQGPMVSSSSQP